MEVGILIANAFAPDFAQRVATGEHPRSELFDLAQRLCGGFLYSEAAAQSNNVIVRTLCRLYPEVGLGLYAWQRRTEFDVYYVGNERVGLVMACMFKAARRRPRLVMLVQNLSNQRKSAIYSWLRLGSSIDKFLCINEYQATFLVEKLLAPRQKVFCLNYGASVDGAFFSPPKQTATSPPEYIFSLGRENRDYDTLIHAVESLPLNLKILQGGLRVHLNPKNIVQRRAANVEVIEEVTYLELRDLYAGCAFVVISMLENVDYPAGITGLIEAMSTGKTVIATYSRGIREYIRDGVTGFWVDAGDVHQLREKVGLLWNNPSLAREMGASAREWVKTRVDMDRYVEELASFVESA